MKKFNYTSLKLLIAIVSLVSVVFLFYYSCNPLIQFGKGTYINVESLINRVYLDYQTFFGVEFFEETTLREFSFVETEDSFIITNEYFRTFELKEGLIYINNTNEYILYGKNFLFKNSNNSLLEKIY